MQEIPAIFHCAYHLSSAEVLMRRKHLCTFPFFSTQMPDCLQRTVWLTLASAELDNSEQQEDTHSLSSNLHVGSCFHGWGSSVTPSLAASLDVVVGSVSCLPVHPQQPGLVFSLPSSYSSPDRLTPQSWRGSSFWLFWALGFLCWVPRRTLRKHTKQLCLPFIGSLQEADEQR